MNKLIIPLFLTFIYAVISSSSIQAETMTMSTFVTSPTGEYQTLRLHPHTPSVTSGCDEGRMYIDTAGDLQICQDDGHGSTNYGSPSSAWKQVGNNLYPTNYSNSSLLTGVGTSAPIVKFHVNGGAFMNGTDNGSDTNLLYFDPSAGQLIAGYRTGATMSTLNSHAFGSDSISLGYNATASGDYAAAIGPSATASGAGSISLGPNTTPGQVSFAAGYGNTTTAPLSVAIGYANSTDYDTTFGTALTSVDATAAIVGIKPIGAVALGTGNTATGYGSSAIGYLNYAQGSYSSAFGNNIRVRGLYSVGIGVGTTAGKTFVTNNAFGVIGGPSYFTRGTSLTANWSIWDAKASGTIVAFFDGHILVNGSMYTHSGGPFVISDARIKTNVVPLQNSLNLITQLNPMEYETIAPTVENGVMHFDVTPETILPGKQVGLIAQDVYKVFPEAVSKPEDETKDNWYVRYNDFIPVLIQAVKEHKAETDQWKAETSALKEEVELLKKELQELKAGR